MKHIRVLRNDLGIVVWQTPSPVEDTRVERIVENLRRNISNSLFTIEVTTP